MGKISKVLLLVIALLVSVGHNFSSEEETQPIDIFLKKSGVWSGEFVNFVNQKDGVIQRGRIRMRIIVDSSGVIQQSIAIIRPDGTATDYQGYSTMKVEGKRLKWEGSITEDENTGNPIENHSFNGHIGWNQIYCVETYEELFPDGRREKRQNNVHYVVLDDGRMIWLADVRVDGKLLVFANTVLVLQK
jgi:hypothetical protein